jgi:hypothetical protein
MRVPNRLGRFRAQGLGTCSKRLTIGRDRTLAEPISNTVLDDRSVFIEQNAVSLDAVFVLVREPRTGHTA